MYTSEAERWLQQDRAKEEKGLRSSTFRPGVRRQERGHNCDLDGRRLGWRSHVPALVVAAGASTLLKTETDILGPLPETGERGKSLDCSVMDAVRLSIRSDLSAWRSLPSAGHQTVQVRGRHPLPPQS